MEKTREALEARISYIPEGESKEFAEEARLLAFLKDRKDADELITCNGYQLLVNQLEDNPIAVMGDMYPEDDARFKDLHSCVDKDELVRIMQGNGFLLSFPYKQSSTGRTALPIAASVESSMYERSKTNCQYIMQEGTDSKRECITLDERSKLVSDAFSKTKRKLHLLIRNGMVWAINDDIHTHTPEYDLLWRLFESLTVFEDYEVKTSFFYNDTSFVRIEICDPVAEKALKAVFEEAELPCEDLHLGVQFFDGVRANASSRLQAVAFLNGCAIPVGEDIRMEHRNDRGVKSASLALWGTKCTELYSVIKDSASAMKKLSDMRIMHPGGVLRLAALREKFPVEATIRVASWFESIHPRTCSALDVYCALFDIIDEYAQGTKLTPVARLGWDEKCARFLRKMGREITDAALSEEAYRILSKG